MRRPGGTVRASAIAAYYPAGSGRDAEGRREPAVVRRALIPLARCALPARPGGGERADALRRALGGRAGHPGRAHLPVRPAPFAFDLLGRALAGPPRRERRGAGARLRRPVVGLDEPRGRRRRPREPRGADLGQRQRRASSCACAAPWSTCASRSSRPTGARCATSARPAAVPGEPPIISRAAWGADESIRRAAPLLRARREDGVRASHGHAERLRARRRAGDHPLDLHLPRALERLERHRLQLPRRRLRAHLRGARRRHRPPRGRRAHGGLQHRQRRHRRDRQRRAGAADDRPRGTRSRA